MNPFKTVKETVDLTPVISDEIKCTTCYMCACRCGIRVHMKNGKIRYIDGNPDHPVNKGVLCAKGSAGLMNHYSQARLSKPLRRVGPRGSGEFEEIEWEEALETAADWLGTVRNTAPERLAFFTGRDQSQSMTGWWAAQFGTPNFAAHGGFCSVNMAAAGLYTLGGAFWEFGEPDWDRTEYFLMFGVAEDHDSNPIKTGLGKIKTRGAKFVSVNPVRTGYSAIADDWVAIRPGTDGLFVFALIHELLRADKIDYDYLVRYTNAHWLVIDAPGDADNGMFARDDEGNALTWCRDHGLVDALGSDISPMMAGEYTLPDGRIARPSFEHLARRYLSDEYTPEAVAKTCGIPVAQIKRIAAELAEAAFDKEITIDQEWEDWTGKKHSKITGRPVTMHAMRGISAHSNGFHTCRAIHILQLLLGSVDVPGGWRMKAPYPKHIPPGPKPAQAPFRPGEPLRGMPIGNVTAPADLVVGADGEPLRIDKAYSWEHPLSSHGLMHMVMHNAWAGDPYPVEVLFLYMANMGWNSSMNPSAAMKYLTDTNEDGSYKIPKVIYSDAYWSETVPYADLILPDTTYLERWDCISLLDRPISSAHGAADAIRHPIVEPDRDVRPFQTVLLDIGARLGLPGMTKEDGTQQYPGGYPDYIVNHLRGPALGPLAGWRGADGDEHGRGAPNPDQLQRYIENGGFWQEHLPLEAQFNKNANAGYLAHAHRMGWIPDTKPITHQIYSEIMQSFRNAADGHGPNQPPERHRDRVREYFDPLPIWYQPFEEEGADDYPVHALTQRPMHMYHSWGGQNAWLRQITAQNRLFMHRDMGADIGVVDDDWVEIESPHGCVTGQVKLVTGVNRDTVWTWNAIGKRKGSWGLDEKAPEVEKGFLLNHVITELLPPKQHGYRYSNSDPVTGQAAWFDLRVRIKKIEATQTSPQFEPMPHYKKAPRPERHGADVKSTQSKGTATRIREWLSTKERFK